MKKLKYISILFFVTISIFSLTSCLEEAEERTQADETAELNSFLSGLINSGYDVDTTELGIYYVVMEEGEGPVPEQGDTITIGYAAYFVDGSLFDSTELYFEDGEYEFIFIDDPVIEGFEDGLKLMNEGSKYELIIPSDLAYGETGTSIVPEYATLIFVTKMIEIRQKVDLDD